MFRAMRSYRPGILSAAAVGLAVVAAGCGAASPGGGAASNSGSGSSAAVGASAACNLFTDAQMATAAGRDINKHDGVDSSLMGQSICTYQGTDLSTPISVSIFYNTKAMQLYQSTEPSAEHIPGLGDDAFWNSTIGSLFVRKGDHALYIADSNFSLVSSGDNSAERDGFKMLAQGAVAKI